MVGAYRWGHLGAMDGVNVPFGNTQAVQQKME